MDSRCPLVIDGLPPLPCCDVFNRFPCAFQAKLEAAKAQGDFKECKKLKVALVIELNCKARRVPIFDLCLPALLLRFIPRLCGL